MPTKESILMKKLRTKRVEQGLCTRCGKNEPKKNRHICSECREYLKKYKKGYEQTKDPIIIRELKKWEVTNLKLYNALIEKRITISEFADMLGVTSRAVEIWVFEDGNPAKERKPLINSLLGEQIY
ncbi:MAG: hypothetical protein ACOCQR_00945 [bacterium]